MTRPVIQQLDARLFERDRWFVIDANQHKIADAPSLQRALDLVARGSAAAVVGRLAPGVAVVDVDAGGIEGDAIAENLIGWLIGRGRWHLLRPSGGGPGRAHVFCVPGDDADALAAYVTDLRTSYGFPASKVDHRGAGGASPWLRPLSSPHRRTGLVPAPLGTTAELHAAADELRRLLTSRRPSTKTTARTKRAQAAAGRSVVALVPLPRRRTEVDSRWSAWIGGSGRVPHVGGGDRSRSAVELAATTALLRAGLSVDDAWATISGARGGAFARARARGRRWWVKYHWNTAVASDTAWRESTPTAGESGPRTSDETARAVAAARAYLRGFQWELGPRKRHSVLLVAHLLLDRMERDDILAVPCPLRNLEIDSGQSRNTVLDALRALEGHLGRRLASFDATRAESSSHIFELDARFTETGMSLLEPPGVTPTNRQPGSWASLPPIAHTLWRSLPPMQVAPLAVPAAAQQAGMTHSPTAEPTAAQRRTVRHALLVLQAAGLAVERPDGTWHQAATLTVQHRRLAAATHHLLVERATRERDQYRSGEWNRWHRDRLAALRANRARQRVWWHTLPELERAQRRRDRAVWFASLPQHEQARCKQRIAVSRHRAGDISERVRHAAWCRQLDRASQADRSAEWQERLLSLSPGERSVRMEHIDEHRRRWHLPSSWSTTATRPEELVAAAAAA